MSQADAPSAKTADPHEHRAGLVARLMAPLHRMGGAVQEKLHREAPTTTDDCAAPEPGSLLARAMAPLSTLTVRLKLFSSRHANPPRDADDEVVEPRPAAPTSRHKDEEQDADAQMLAARRSNARRKLLVLASIGGGAALLIAAAVLGLNSAYQSLLGDQEREIAAARQAVKAKDEQLGFMAEELRQKEERLRTLRARPADPRASPASHGVSSTALAERQSSTEPAHSAHTAESGDKRIPGAHAQAASSTSAAGDRPPASGECELKGTGVSNKLMECIAAFNRSSQ